MLVSTMRHHVTQLPNASVRFRFNCAVRHFASAAQSQNRSIDSDEIQRFRAVADQWWDPFGKFGKLQLLNQARLSFIRRAVESATNQAPKSSSPLKGLRVLDVGCGGGLLAEPLARLGGTITAIDATAESIFVAQAHIDQDPSIAHSVEYKHCTIEDILDQDQRYDVVIASEVVEHVTSAEEFISECSQALRPDGVLILSTINRTPLAYSFGIFMAENVLGWVPQGTHNYSKFKTPTELEEILEAANLSVSLINGMSYMPLSQRFELTDDVSINYILAATASQQTERDKK